MKTELTFISITLLTMNCLSYQTKTEPTEQVTKEIETLAKPARHLVLLSKSVEIRTSPSGKKEIYVTPKVWIFEKGLVQRKATGATTTKSWEFSGYLGFGNLAHNCFGSNGENPDWDEEAVKNFRERSGKADAEAAYAKQSFSEKGVYKDPEKHCGGTILTSTILPFWLFQVPFVLPQILFVVPFKSGTSTDYGTPNIENIDVNEEGLTHIEADLPKNAKVSIGLEGFGSFQEQLNSEGKLKIDLTKIYELRLKKSSVSWEDFLKSLAGLGLIQVKYDDLMSNSTGIIMLSNEIANAMEAEIRITNSKINKFNPFKVTNQRYARNSDEIPSRDQLNDEKTKALESCKQQFLLSSELLRNNSAYFEKNDLYKKASLLNASKKACLSALENNYEKSLSVVVAEEKRLERVAEREARKTERERRATQAESSSRNSSSTKASNLFTVYSTSSIKGGGQMEGVAAKLCIDSLRGRKGSVCLANGYHGLSFILQGQAIKNCQGTPLANGIYQWDCECQQEVNCGH